MADHPNDLERARDILRRAPHADVSERMLLDVLACVRAEGRLSVLDELTVAGAAIAEAEAQAATHVDPAGAIVSSAKPGNIILSSSMEEVLRFEPNGKVFVRGELVDDNQAIYEAFKSWMRACGSLP